MATWRAGATVRVVEGPVERSGRVGVKEGAFGLLIVAVMGWWCVIWLLLGSVSEADQELFHVDGAHVSARHIV